MELKFEFDMEFINKGLFSSIIYFFITIMGIFLFFNFLPVIFFIGLAIWGIFRVVNAFKNRKGKYVFNEERPDSVVEAIVKDDYDTKNAIDVDFIEIK